MDDHHYPLGQTSGMRIDDTDDILECNILRSISLIPQNSRSVLARSEAPLKQLSYLNHEPLEGTLDLSAFTFNRQDVHELWVIECCSNIGKISRKNDLLSLSNHLSIL